MNYLENLKVLRNAVAAEPEQLFDLSRFEQTAPCGTLHCTAGLACTLPYFQRMGLQLVGDDWGGLYPQIDKLPVPHSFTALDVALNHLFLPFPGCEPTPNLGAFEYLFQSHGDGEWDKELGYWDLPHKELALARLDKAITLWEKA